MTGEIFFVAVLMILGFGAYWAMILFPKQRDFQKRQQTVRNLNPGDEVITYGGIIGRVIEVDADMGIVHVEIAEGIIVRLITAAVMQEYNPDEIARNAQIGLGKEPSATVES